MLDSERPFFRGLRLRIFGTVIALAVLAGLMIPITKAPDQPVVPPLGENVVEVTEEQNQCTRDLERILNGMQPGRVGINTDAADLAVELNRWFSKCGSEVEAGLTDDIETQQELFAEEDFERLQDKLYRAADVEHIRNCLLAGTIVTNLCQDIGNDRECVLKLFDYTVRSTLILDPETPLAAIPATPYEALVWGRGTAELRAWTFATLLKQLRLDAVILTPNQKPDAWLVGVLVPEQGVLLFDPRLGLPVPDPEETSATQIPTSAAHLSQVLQDESTFRKLDTPESKYPVTASDLKDLTVGMIGTPSLWSRRLAEFQFMAEPLVAVEFYDGLGKNALHPEGAQRERLVKVGESLQLWSSAQIAVWNHPREQLAALKNAQGLAESEFQSMLSIFSGPLLIKVDPLNGHPVIDSVTGQPLFAAAETTLHAVRIEQLLGEHNAALRHFGPILTSYRTNPSSLNEEAANYAAFWIGISQWEAQHAKAAISSFERFSSTLRRSPTQLVPLDLMRRTALEWKAATQLSIGDLPEAMSTLKAAQVEFPSLRNEILLERWEQVAKASGTTGSE